MDLPHKFPICVLSRESEESRQEFINKIPQGDEY
jgi:hypothetical protein